MKIIHNLYVALFGIRFGLHYLLIRRQECCRSDLARWHEILRRKRVVSWFAFADIMMFYPEYRALVYARIRVKHPLLSHVLTVFGRPQPLLSISAANVGGGLYIQHGFGTIVAPRRIGRNCWINQGVTVGYTNDTDCPVIGDDVTIGAGAKVLGRCVVGDRVVIGANAVVVKDVPSDCTVVGVPAYIVRRDGRKVHQEL